MVRGENPRLQLTRTPLLMDWESDHVLVQGEVRDADERVPVRCVSVGGVAQSSRYVLGSPECADGAPA